MNTLRTSRSLWMPIVVASLIGAVLGTGAGMIEAQNCASHLGPVGLILGTWFLFLLGIAMAIGGLLVCGIGWRRHAKKTVQAGLGMVVAGVALPAVFYLVTATFRTTACGASGNPF